MMLKEVVRWVDGNFLLIFFKIFKDYFSIKIDAIPQSLSLNTLLLQANPDDFKTL